MKTVARHEVHAHDSISVVEKNARVLAELKAAGVPCMAVAGDVTDRAALEPAFRRVEAELGPVDILVNNAGIVSLSGCILQESPESWDSVIETQLNAVFLLSKIAATSMARRKRGKIINIASMYSYFGPWPSSLRRTAYR